MSIIKKWTKYEEIELIREIKNNCTIDEICKSDNRSKKAITFRLYNIAYRTINNKNITIQKVCDTLKIDLESFNQVLNNMKLYESIDRINRPLTYISCEDQFIDDDTETTEDSITHKKQICTKCLKYESIIDRLTMDYQSIKNKNRSHSDKLIFDIYSDDSDIFEEINEVS
jgi:hypothetical protein